MQTLRPLMLCLALACSLVNEAVAHEPNPAPTVRALPNDWYPESLAAGPDGSLYVGSWRQGAVAQLKPGGSPPKILVTSGSNGLDNAQGVLVDAKAHLLWVCSGNLGYTTVPATPSALKSYDLATGEPRASYPMPDGGYCNDLAQARNGTIYVTDSYHPRILKLARGDAALHVWLNNPTLGSGDAKFYLNGIAIDPSGALYVSAVMAAPYILRVKVRPDGAPGAITRISAPRILRNVDALRYLDQKHLVLFESDAFGHEGPYGGAVTLARLGGDRMTRLTTLVAGLNDPSSGLVLNGRVDYIQSKYGILFAHPRDNTAVPRHVPFSVDSVALPHAHE